MACSFKKILALFLLLLTLALNSTPVRAQSIVEWTVPTLGAAPFAISVYNGLVYFTETTGSHKIGRLDPSTGTFNEWPTPTASSEPRGIAVYNNLVYFTEFSGNKIGRLDPSTGTFNEWDVPTANARPWGIAVYNGLVYFTEEDGNKIGRLDPSTGTFNEWPIPTAGSKPVGIDVYNGLAYFTEYSADKIGRLTPEPTKLVITVFPYAVVRGSWTTKYTVQRQDNGIPVTWGSTVVNLASDSAGPAKKFAETPGGGPVASITIPDGSSTKDFYYYDELPGTWTISVSATGLTGDSKPLTVAPIVTVTATRQITTLVTVSGTTTLTIMGLEHVTHTVILVASTTTSATVTSLSTTTATFTRSTTTSTSTTSTTTTTATTTMVTTTTETVPRFLAGRCVIATAAYGSELAPEVQFIRTVRDQVIGSTFCGNAFVKALNNFYYSFSPTAASVVAQNPLLARMVRVLLYPSIAAIHAGSIVFRSLDFAPELATIVSLAVISTFVGATYLGPIAVAAKIGERRRRTRNRGTLSID